MGYIIKDTAALINSKLTDAGRKKISEGTFKTIIWNPINTGSTTTYTNINTGTTSNWTKINTGTTSSWKEVA